MGALRSAFIQTRTQSLLGGGREETAEDFGKEMRGAQRVMGTSLDFYIPENAVQCLGSNANQKDISSICFPSY